MGDRIRKLERELEDKFRETIVPPEKRRQEKALRKAFEHVEKEKPKERSTEHEWW